jgi:hypothetical protein
MHSASDELAGIVIERLVREHLLSKAEARKILRKLAEGSLTAEDWRAALQRSVSANPQA